VRDADLQFKLWQCLARVGQTAAQMAGERGEGPKTNVFYRAALPDEVGLSGLPGVRPRTRAWLGHWVN
jgi:hypothetical protein